MTEVARARCTWPEVGFYFGSPGKRGIGVVECAWCICKQATDESRDPESRENLPQNQGRWKEPTPNSSDLHTCVMAQVATLGMYSTFVKRYRNHV